MRNDFLRAFAIVAVLSLVAISGAFAAEKEMTPLDIPMIKDMEALKIGEPAPAFDAKDLAGVRVAFKPLDPGAKLLIFWSIFCEPCREEMPLIQALYDKHKATGLNVLSVVLDGGLEENIRQFIKLGKYSFTVLLDEENKEGSLVVAEKYMVPGTPTIYVVDGKGKITYSRVGRTSEVELEKAIVSALGK